MSEQGSHWATLEQHLADDAESLTIGEPLPIDPVKIAQARGVPVRLADGKSEGRLRRRGSVHEIVIGTASDGANTRKRFTIAHELAHFLIEQRVRIRPRSKREYWQLERVCHRFAGQLLLPAWLLRTQVPARPSSPHRLLGIALELASAGDLSFEATAHRLVEHVGRVGFCELSYRADGGKINWCAEDQGVIGGNRGKHFGPRHPLSQLLQAHRDSASRLRSGALEGQPLVSQRIRDRLRVAMLMREPTAAGPETSSASQPMLPAFG